MDSSNNKNLDENDSNKKSLSRFNVTAVTKFISWPGWRSLFKRNRKGPGKNGHKQSELDKKLVYSLSKSRFPSFKQIKYIKQFLTRKELWLLRISLAILLGSILFWGGYYYYSHLEEVPLVEGEYIEALIGAPKYINPLYASISDVDRDISVLIFSSLLKRDKQGSLVNDLAQGYEVSEDNKAYTFKIRTDALWHNGDPVTVDDIIYTFNAIQDSNYKSPLRTSFQGVTAEKIDDNSLRFILAEPYAAFLELLTFGILPRELWYQIPADTANLAELNLKPIGSGPYKFKSLSKDKTGNIREYYLEANEQYYEHSPYVRNLIFYFFPSFEEAIASLNEQGVDGISYLPKEQKDDILSQVGYNFYELNLPQLTAIFFNQDKNPSLSDKKVRQALAYAINKNEIISSILGGEARSIYSPILPSSFAHNQEVAKYAYNIETAQQLLDEAGWKYFTITEEEVNKSREVKDTSEEAVRRMAETVVTLDQGEWRRKDDNFLIIQLTTVSRRENDRIIEAIKQDWEKIGVKTVLNIVEPSAMQTEVLKPRNYEALFYGLVVGADPDMYPLWHSSQISENGLNIAKYSNPEVDQLLEDARVIADIEARKEKYFKFQEILTEEVPTIFLYSPTYTYVQAKRIKGFDVNTILIPRDRFSNITEWYIKTGKKLKL